ncbi:MAG: 2-hydroxyacid dehydrogenase [Oscillospiraceae bacterium]
MKIIQITNTYKGSVLDIVKQFVPDGFAIRTLPENSTEALAACVVEADYLLASGRVKITKEVLDKAMKLKMVQRTGVGLDSLDLEELKKRKIPLYVNRGVNAESVAEHALLLILACLRKLPIVHENTKNGIWKKQEQGIQTFELAGKTVGLIGMGNIARVLVRLLRGFGVQILYYDHYRLDPGKENELGITYCELADLMPCVDILSLHCPLTEQTRKMMNAKTIAKMKKGGILVNTARGGLVDTAALVGALKTGHLAFAALDVHEEEPLKSTNEITKLENVILTSHIGGITRDSFSRMMSEAMRNIEKFELGELDEISRYLH